MDDRGSGEVIRKIKNKVAVPVEAETLFKLIRDDPHLSIKESYGEDEATQPMTRVKSKALHVVEEVLCSYNPIPY